MSMNADRHSQAFMDQILRVCHAAKPAIMTRTTSFYDEYLAVMDMPAEFYLSTVETYLQEGSRSPATNSRS